MGKTVAIEKKLSTFYPQGTKKMKLKKQKSEEVSSIFKKSEKSGRKETLTSSNTNDNLSGSNVSRSRTLLNSTRLIEAAPLTPLAKDAFMTSLKS